MKKILMSLMTMVVVIGLVGAGAFALFNDTETSTGNTFTAGTLDLAVGGENPNVSPDFTIANVKPGDSGTITYTLSNVGSLPGYLDLSGITVTNTEGLNPESEGDTTEPGDLGANLNVTVTLGGTVLYGSAALNGIAAAYDADVLLGAGLSTTLVITWGIPSGVGNDIQGDVATVGLTIELDQIAD